jgi:hypothetical protein
VDEPSKFTRTTFEIEAFQVTPGNIFKVAEWCGGKILSTDAIKDRSNLYIKIQEQHQKNARAFVGYWITKSDTGFKVYTDEGFKKNFIPAMTDEEKYEDVLKLVEAAMQRQADATHFKEMDSTAPFAEETARHIVGLI